MADGIQMCVNTLKCVSFSYEYDNRYEIVYLFIKKIIILIYLQCNVFNTRTLIRLFWVFILNLVRLVFIRGYLLVQMCYAITFTRRESKYWRSGNNTFGFSLWQSFQTSKAAWDWWSGALRNALGLKLLSIMDILLVWVNNV